MVKEFGLVKLRFEIVKQGFKKIVFLKLNVLALLKTVT